MGRARWTLIPLLANALVAIGPTGAITGTVTDATGADVPKAIVTVTDQATNATRVATTNFDGDFTAGRPPGF
jgi:outer membrane receptor protein involved in Fe transport